MDIAKIREKAEELQENYCEYIAIIAAMELDYLGLTDEELEVAIDRIKAVHEDYDYSTAQGVACAYGYWFDTATNKNDVEDWVASYEIGDWR